jgi:hypothetical protein
MAAILDEIAGRIRHNIYSKIHLRRALLLLDVNCRSWVPTMSTRVIYACPP